MPLKFRREIKATGGFKAGSAGTSVADFIAGTACLNCPSALGDETVVGASLAITNVSDGDKLFVTPMTSVQEDMYLASACCVSGGISASWSNAASSDSSASADIPISYLILK